jgi:hypothetical protein
MSLSSTFLYSTWDEWSLWIPQQTRFHSRSIQCGVPKFQSQLSGSFKDFWAATGAASWQMTTSHVKIWFEIMSRAVRFLVDVWSLGNVRSTQWRQSGSILAEWIEIRDLWIECLILNRPWCIHTEARTNFNAANYLKIQICATQSCHLNYI